MPNSDDNTGWFAPSNGGEKFIPSPATEAEFMDNIIFQASSAEGYFTALRETKDMNFAVSIKVKLNHLEESLKEFREFREAKTKED